MRDDLRILADRSYRMLFLARTLSLLGSAVIPVALAFAILDAPGGSATDLGLVLAARSLAQVALLLFGGVLADRMNRFRLMVGSDLLAFAAQAVLTVVFVSGRPSLPVVIALSAVNGAAAALFLPASRGVVPQVVAQEQLQSANALLRLSRNSTTIGGAALAGVLVAALGAGWALAVPAATFLGSALLLAGVRVSHPGRAATSTILADLREGWREFSSRSWVWLVVVQFAFVNGCFSAIHVLGPLTAKEQLGGATAWSVIVTAQAVGLVGGSLVAMRIRPRRPMRVAVLATFGFLPPFALIAAGAPVWLIAASMLVNGVCVDIFEVLWDTALQNHVPNEALSRISSYDAMGSFVLGPLCLAVVGPVADRIGVAQTLVIAGGVLALVTVATFCARSVRQLPARVPDAQPATV
ncbi:MFS transporter [Micromonospora sp. URMC 107]|uniref:MFS transporter n=1 Tax=Micromonospora sp. URMC 107 TaxID=3423418 RepID=UPI003F1A463A